MPDHVHLILRPIVQEAQGQCVSRVTHSIKSWLAHRINDVMGRSGPVWHEESWDSVIRNAQDYTTKAAYIYDNPRRKGLVDDPSKWPWWGIGSGGG